MNSLNHIQNPRLALLQEQPGRIWQKFIRFAAVNINRHFGYSFYISSYKKPVGMGSGVYGVFYVVVQPAAIAGSLSGGFRQADAGIY